MPKILLTFVADNGESRDIISYNADAAASLVTVNLEALSAENERLCAKAALCAVGALAHDPTNPASVAARGVIHAIQAASVESFMALAALRSNADRDAPTLPVRP